MLRAPDVIIFLLLSGREAPHYIFPFVSHPTRLDDPSRASAKVNSTILGAQCIYSVFRQEHSVRSAVSWCLEGFAFLKMAYEEWLVTQEARAYGVKHSDIQGKIGALG